MKTKILSLAFLVLSIATFAQYRKNGMPDMRYKQNREMYNEPSYQYNYDRNEYRQIYQNSNGSNDDRYQENRQQYSTPHQNQDGTPDRRYKENQYYPPN